MRAPVFMLMLCASALRAAPTAVQVRPEAPGVAWEARYSQAVLLSAQLLDAEGAPIVGRRVAFFAGRADEPESEFFVDDPFTDTEGVARARLALVDGRHGVARFAAEAASAERAGLPYRVRARFAGDLDARGCSDEEPGAAPVTDAGPGAPGIDGHCASEGEGALYVTLENPTLTLQPGIEARLGESTPLVATLRDDNGNAPAGGLALDGAEATPLAGRRVAFFYDADGNGRPSAAERLGEAETNAEGMARFDFLADPTYVRAQEVAAGVHAQFGGDDQFALAGAAQALTVWPGAPVAARALLALSATEVPADGYSRIEVRVTLVDGYNNLLGPDEEAHEVRLSAERDGNVLSSWSGDLLFDPLSGEYQRSLVAPLEAGDVTLQLWVEEEAGPSARVRVLPRGCACASPSRKARAAWPPVSLWLCGGALLWLTRRPGRGRGRWPARDPQR